MLRHGPGTAEATLGRLHVPLAGQPGHGGSCPAGGAVPPARHLCLRPRSQAVARIVVDASATLSADGWGAQSQHPQRSQQQGVQRARCHVCELGG